MSRVIRTKRAYEPPADDDGLRVLVDRLWPRGLTKEAAQVDLWVKEIAPTNELRKWYKHEPEKWDEFRRRYANELATHEGEVAALEEQLDGRVTFLFSSKEEHLNNATALKEYLDARSGG